MGPEYSCAFRPELARNWSAASPQPLFERGGGGVFFGGSDPEHGQSAFMTSSLLSWAMRASSGAMTASRRPAFAFSTSLPGSFSRAPDLDVGKHFVGLWHRSILIILFFVLLYSCDACAD
jgi:hypothetical protein